MTLLFPTPGKLLDVLKEALEIRALKTTPPFAVMCGYNAWGSRACIERQFQSAFVPKGTLPSS